MKKSRDVLELELREAGLKATPQRLEVLAVLHEVREPISHAEVCERSVYQRATVYRALVDLVGAGIAAKHDIGAHGWRFTHASARWETPRVVFVDADGKRRELSADAVTLTLGPGAPRELTESGYTVVIRARRK